MKCSKCGFDNPENAIFCEKCDWKLGETYIPEIRMNRGIFSIAALVLGVVSVCLVAFDVSDIAGLVLGAVGLVLGGYSFNYSRLANHANKNVYLACSAIGLLTSVAGFMFGLVEVV